MNYKVKAKGVALSQSDSGLSNALTPGNENAGTVVRIATYDPDVDITDGTGLQA